MSELRALAPADPPDDDDEAAGEPDETGAPRLSALRHRLGRSVRPLAVVAGTVVLVGWSVAMWSLVTSMAAIDESIGVLALQVSGQQAGPGPAALEPAADQPETNAASIFSAMFEFEAEFDAAFEAAPAPTPEPTPTFPATLFGKAVVTDGADLWNCTEFETHQQAQMVYEANLPDDPNILDFDANGTPCDSLLSTEEGN